MKKNLLISLTIGLGLLTSSAYAAGDAPVPPKQQWSWQGFFGTYDRAAAQRGFQVYREVCSGCHALKYISYRNLTEIGFSEAEVEAIAAEYTHIDGPNDQGEMFERPGIPADRFKRPYANDKEAAYANNGAIPADLSLVVKARNHGADYVFALLNGYVDAPEDVILEEGQYYNKYFPGQKIAMASPLVDGAVTYSDGTDANMHQMTHDLVTFLAWASEPELEERKRTGAKVILFLLFFSVLLYLLKKQIWSRLKD